MRRRDPEGTKQRIAEGALKAFYRKGYARTTMDDIVAHSGVSKGGIYWHFKGKEEIFLYLLQAWIDYLYQSYQEIRFSNDSVEVQMRRLIERSFERGDQTIICLGTEFWLCNLSNPQVLQALQQVYGRYQEMFRNLLFEGMVRGEFVTNNIEQLTFSFMGLIGGIFSYQALMGDLGDSSQALKIGVEVFMQGIRKERRDESDCGQDIGR